MLRFPYDEWKERAIKVKYLFLLSVYEEMISSRLYNTLAVESESNSIFKEEYIAD